MKTNNRWSREKRPPLGIKTLNPSEIAVASRLQNQGYQIIKRGWPDFIAVRDSEIRFIEVKRHANQQLKPAQKQIASILQHFGINVEILCH